MTRRADPHSRTRHFAGIPDTVIDSAEFRGLSGAATKLLLLLAKQYRGRNNGDLAATFEQLRDYRFKSQHTVKRAIDELLEANLITRTRMGYFQNPGGRCALYALNWQPIDECPGKGLEAGPTLKPPRLFKSLSDAEAKLLRRPKKTARPMQKVHKAGSTKCTENGKAHRRRTGSGCRNCNESDTKPDAHSARLIKLPRVPALDFDFLVLLSAEHPTSSGSGRENEDCELLAMPSVADCALTGPAAGAVPALAA